jgi:hypothetical protein
MTGADWFRLALGRFDNAEVVHYVRMAGRCAFVNVANFTAWVQDPSVHVGALSLSHHVALQLRRHLERLPDSEQLRRLPGF